MRLRMTIAGNWLGKIPIDGRHFSDRCADRQRAQIAKPHFQLSAFQVVDIHPGVAHLHCANLLLLAGLWQNRSFAPEFDLFATW